MIKMNNTLFNTCTKTTAEMIVATIRRNCFSWKRFRIILLTIIVLFILINFIMTLYTTSHQHNHLNAAKINSLKYNNSNNWIQYGDASKYISIEVLSSKDRVRICVDDATVIDDSGPSSSRGLHIVVLNQHTGMVMAQRVFDTYMDDEPLIQFLHSVSNGRIMIFAIEDEASFHLTNKGKRAMQMHIGGGHTNTKRGGSSSTAGDSLWLSQLGWRDMWAMVAKHQNDDLKTDTNSVDGLIYGESYSRNPGLVIQRNSKSVGTTSSWGSDVMLRVQVPLDINHNQNNLNNDWCESWIIAAASVNNHNDDGDFGDSNLIFDENMVVESQLARRRRFCSRIEGYGDVCSCLRPVPLDFHPLPIPDSNIDQVPVVIIAGNRADYLYRTIKSVLNARGVKRHMITVHIDGFYDEPVEVARLLGVRAVQHMPAIGDSVNVNGGHISSKSSSLTRRRRVTQHYKSALTNTFGTLFPQAEYAIVLEDDLEVSIDFFSFFSQTLPLLAATDDSTDGNSAGSGSLYCVSAWNDQGYKHTASRPNVLYRVDWMPGLGWMLKKSLYKDQLESEWPTVEKPWDWDMWMRSSRVQRGRQCVVPEVSRTYHFGSSRAVNVNPYFQQTYFGNHAFYNYNIAREAISNSGGTGGEYDDGGGLIHFQNIDKMTQTAYLEWMERRIVLEGQLLDHSKWPCRKKQWNSGGARNGDSRDSDNGFQYTGDTREYRRVDEEFFIIEEMINNNSSIRFKQLFILYIQMDDPNGINRETASFSWSFLAKCLDIWDLDVRGHYKGMWRLYLNHENENNYDDGRNAAEEGISTHSISGNELFIIGCPFSYFCKFKPDNVTAIWYNSNGGGGGEDDDDDGL